MVLDFKTISTVLIPYLITIAILYLFGYWGSFNINILEYATLSEVAKLSIYPLLASLFLVGAGFIFIELFLSGMKNTTDDISAKNSNPKLIRMLLAGVIVLILVVLLFAIEPLKWFLISFLLGTFTIPLKNNSIVIRAIPDQDVRLNIVYLGILLPGLSFSLGKLEAYMIKNGYPSNIVDINRSKLSQTFNQKNKIAVIGFVNGTYMLYDSTTNQIIHFKPSESTPLIISPQKR